MKCKNYIDNFFWNLLTVEIRNYMRRLNLSVFIELNPFALHFHETNLFNATGKITQSAGYISLR